MSETEGSSATLPAVAGDLELVERHRRGDKSAFSEIVESYSNLLYNLAFRMTGNREDALDLHQEVLLKVYRSLGRFRGQASLRTWMYRITVNAAKNRARWWSRVKRGSAYSLDTSDEDHQPASERIADPRPGPEGQAYGTEIKARVQQGLDHLPVGQRSVVVLRDVEGLEYREIATSLGISLGTVKSRLARGWDRLRGGLERRPQQLSLKPVFLAGLAFLMALVVFQGFQRFSVAPEAAAPPIVAEAPPQPAAPGGLAGTTGFTDLTDAQKAEVVRRMAEAAPPVDPAPQVTGGAGLRPALEGHQAAAPAPDEALPRAESVIASGGEGPGSEPVYDNVRAAPRQDDPMGRPASTPGGFAGRLDADRSPEPEATEPSGAAAAPPVRIAVLSAGQPEPVAASEPESPAAADEPASRPGRRASSRARDRAEGPLELGLTFHEVLVLGQAATFRPAEIDLAGRELSLNGEESGAGETEAPPLPEADAETGIAAPHPLVRVAPDLAGRAEEPRHQQILGPLALRVTVRADGSVGEVGILPDSGSGLPWLDRAVAEAVRGWEFLPARRESEPITATIELVVEFDVE